jgi:hypothetical protein
MSSRKILIVYTDGSYANGKSGWRFMFHATKIIHLGH